MSELTWGPEIFDRAVAILLVLLFDAQEEAQYVKDYKLDESSNIYTAKVKITKNELWQLIISKYRIKIEDILKDTEPKKAEDFWKFFDSKDQKYQGFSVYIKRLLEIDIFDSNKKDEGFRGNQEWVFTLKVKEKPNNLNENIRFLIYKWNNNNSSKKEDASNTQKTVIKEENVLYNLNQSQNESELNRQDLSNSESILIASSHENSEINYSMLTNSDKRDLVEEIKRYYVSNEDSLENIFQMYQEVFGTNLYGETRGQSFNIRISSLVQELINRNKLDDFIRIIRQDYPNFAIRL